jgi:hypothetical protein
MNHTELTDEALVALTLAGDQNAYEDMYADIGTMPESPEKSYATAQLPMLGRRWLPDGKSDERFTHMKEAVLAGRNEDVITTIMSIEYNKLSGAAKIEYMRDTQIPFLEENSFNKALGYVLFWLGREYLNAGEPAQGFAAFERVLTVL